MIEHLKRNNSEVILSICVKFHLESDVNFTKLTALNRLTTKNLTRKIQLTPMVGTKLCS